VKFNRLVWPYAVNAGDHLMVPTRPLTPDELYQKSQGEFLPAIWQYLLSFRTSLYHPVVGHSAEKKTRAKPRRGK
jgi:hypothetical protein